ncbi:hypothetical protein SOCEGT47_010050 [Sorangium cellulosum]|uniref:STAS/SEC14 domain-containing protein n=1 Tax=Sorangium cellulosum TaxID=56 RepID=A0A4P2PVP2_SORCE|nr:hypothetical protein [Sorangium cellulosum]AUX20533.1 hypothetical protein SOCEGT47_010050 [Sorangium cellulosum]
MDLAHTRLGARGDRWATSRGVLEVRTPAVDVVTRRFEGHATPELIEPAIRHLETLIASGLQPILFNDFELGTGYDSEVRAKLTAWHLRHAGSVKEIHILVRPGLVAMGVTVANLATGGRFLVYTDRSKFEWTLANALTTRITAGSPASLRAPSY